MIKVVARSIIKEGCLTEALQLYRLLIDETVQEKDCISTSYFRN